MQSSDSRTLEVPCKRGRSGPAVFFGGRQLLFFWIIFSPLFSAAQSSPPARFDSAQVFFRAMPVAADSSFRLRAYFFNGKNYPRYLYWRSQTVRGYEKTRESGDFVTLARDTALVWEGLFKLEKDDPRSINFYVIDNDLIVGFAEAKLALLTVDGGRRTADGLQPEPQPTIAQTNNPVGVPSDKTDGMPPGLPTTTADGGRRTADDKRPAEATPQPPATQPENQSPKTNQPVTGLRLAKDDFEIDGILTSDVRTNFGRQFMAFFNEKWSPPEKAGGYWVSIKEVLTPGRFTLLSVSLNNRELFRQYLTPSPEFLKDLAGQTADLLAQIIKSGDPDGGFSDEDLNGVGIE